jgi:hypothetical protein
MPIEYPPQIKFEHLVSYTFPGFFSAISVFMIIDYLSPINFLSSIGKDFNNFLMFLGIIILFGTILGIIIDGIHHLIESGIFDKTQTVIELDKTLYKYRKKARKKLEIDATLKLDNYIYESSYSISEFYCNTFISLLLFSFIIPFYLMDVFYINWYLSVIFAVSSYFLAIICLYSSYKAYCSGKRSIIAITEDLMIDSPSCDKKSDEKKYNINFVLNSKGSWVSTTGSNLGYRKRTVDYRKDFPRWMIAVFSNSPPQQKKEDTVEYVEYVDPRLQKY